MAIWITRLIIIMDRMFYSKYSSVNKSSKVKSYKCSVQLDERGSLLKMAWFTSCFVIQRVLLKSPWGNHFRLRSRSTLDLFEESSNHITAVVQNTDVGEIVIKLVMLVNAQ